jgi:uncharacterized protein YutE (UPF0331/DUF86 family)
MRLDLYQAETARIATEQAGQLTLARELLTQRSLSSLEQGGVLHAVQVLIENAIGKAKLLIKAHNEAVPVSAYDTFTALARCGLIDAAALPNWNAVIGLRNRIVHDYMNIDMAKVMQLVVAGNDPRNRSWTHSMVRSGEWLARSDDAAYRGRQGGATKPDA